MDKERTLQTIVSRAFAVLLILLTSLVAYFPPKDTRDRRQKLALPQPKIDLFTPEGIVPEEGLPALAKPEIAAGPVEGGKSYVEAEKEKRRLPQKQASLP